MSYLKITKLDIVNELKSQVIEVTFDKINGDERVMRCTLDPKYLPPAVEVKEEASVKSRGREDAVSVYDVDAKDWRSFRVDRVKHVRLHLPDFDGI
jgi:hypothetical protein